MDNVSSLECLKLDSPSELLDKDGGGKDLFSPTTVPHKLNCDTPIIDSMAEEPETTEPTEEELLAFFHEGPPMLTGSEFEESMDWKSMDWKPEDWKSEDEESEDWESEVEESEDEKSMDGEIYGECKYCLKVDKHPTQLCSYRYRVPKNAIVGQSCVVECLVCGCLFRDSSCADCGLSRGRAVLKDCTICGKKGEHLNYECPKREEKHSGFNYDPYTGYFDA